jgi:hypothetical protein
MGVDERVSEVVVVSMCSTNERTAGCGVKCDGRREKRVDEESIH